jgi:hypothetical protein
MSYFPEQLYEVTISAAACKTLNSVPVLLVPGKAGCIVDIKSCLIRYTPGTIPFNPDWSGTTDIFQVYTGNNSSINSVFSNYTVDCADFVDQTTSEMAIVGNWWVSGLAVPLSDVEGQGIYLLQYDSNSNFPTGVNWTAGNGSLTVFTKAAYIEA